MIQKTLVRILSEAVAAAASQIGLPEDDLPTPELLKPRQKEHGDWSTNIALVLAPKAGLPPRQVAEAVLGQIHAPDVVAKAEIAGPGFINLFLGHGWLHQLLAQILEEGAAFGRTERLGQRVQVEFVSANPVGPLHVGTARNAALGDSVANVLDAAGWDVEREYYFNDANRQIDLYGESVEARYLQHFGVAAELPEQGYQGQHVIDVALEIAREHGDDFVNMDPAERRTALRELAIAKTMEGIRRTLDRFRIHFDTWANERDFHQTGAIFDVVRRLQDAGFAYEQEGAIFFRSTQFGDDRDRVVIRSNGKPTYFGADCAYLLHKAAAGFDRLIYVWGADHHGTVKRLLGAAQALGVKASVEILLYQLVSLYRGGKPVKMSKRAGDYVMLDELLDEVGPDAARYNLLSRSSDSTIDFDIELVTRQSLENPVYYVQYAHARIASLLRVAAEQGVKLRSWREVDLAELVQEAELDLVRKLGELPEVVTMAAEGLAPHRLTRFAEDAAASFHRFYTECRVITDDDPLTQARLWLATAAKQVIGGTLALIGVSAPESMERIGGQST